MQLFNYKALKKALNQSAKTYDANAKVANLTGGTLIERLQILKINPKKILDIGAGTGQLAEHLNKLYPTASIYNLDLAEQRLQISKRNEHRLAICTDMHTLPFIDECFDLITTNLCWHWINNVSQTISEAHRVLKPNGAIVLASLGPDSLHELKTAFAEVSAHAHISPFLDMHDLGDALLKAGFADPVIDVEYINLELQNLQQLFDMLKNTGESNYLTTRHQGLHNKNLIEKVKAVYQKHQKTQTPYATIEIIFAYAWRKDKPQKLINNEIHIPISKIRKQTNI